MHSLSLEKKTQNIVRQHPGPVWGDPLTGLMGGFGDLLQQQNSFQTICYPPPLPPLLPFKNKNKTKTFNHCIYIYHCYIQDHN